MERYELDDSGRPVRLPHGYALRTPGLVGSVDMFTPEADGGLMRAAAPATEEFEAAFRNAQMSEAATIALDAREIPVGEAAHGLRSLSGDDALELEVPDLGEERGQIVLSLSEDGVLTWHFPVNEDASAIEAPTTRGAGGVKRFRIPRAVTPVPPAGASEHRGFVGAVGRKLLKVLVYPVTDPILGPISEHFAHQWEEKNRPYKARAFTADSYNQGGVPALSADDWRRLAAGPALLFVHGTFSTSHGCFGALPRSLMAELERRYDGRVIAFDTFTLSEDPDENANRFFAMVPPDISLNVDVVCHSRGGLVTRQLAVRGAQSDRLKLRRAVFVGVPNAGTALADAAHMVQMIDRLSSALVLLPSGPITESMEAILTALKVIGHGALKGLPGLAAMQPKGPFLQQLNSAAASGEYYAITADFEPNAGTLRGLFTQHAANHVVDRIFSNTANDLVVPTAGVYEVQGSSGFPVPPERLLRFDARAGVIHTTYFGAAETANALERWLLA